MAKKPRQQARGTRAGRAKGVAIHHDMKVYENFERSAQRIFECVQAAQKRSPGAPRYLFLDIQGHRNEAGGFDHDAYELMTEFCLGFLGDYLTEISSPLVRARNPKAQRDDIPDLLRIGYPDDGSDYGYDARTLAVKPREKHPADRRSRPTAKAIAAYLGMDEPSCLVCWRTPVERAHVVPRHLGGSMDVRNFALLCPAHHAEAPDVADAESFWAWVDYAELRDSPDKWLDASDRQKEWLREHGVRIGAGEREPLSFFAAVKHELKSLYGWTDADFEVKDWLAFMDEVHQVLKEATGRHFGVDQKASTHAWAYHMARQRRERRGG
ncbi:HNH endonuclease [Streptomyces sp. NPDC001980]|uniref:HNH endonuclease n=1 Tax=Streptomyces sp. NPDC001980 TaxID=3157126 RepID=UPI0033172CEB